MLVNFDALKIRKNIDNDYKFFSDLLYEDFDIQEIKAIYFKLYKYLVYANQVLDNHKVINYHSVGFGLKMINEIEIGTIYECYEITIKPEMQKLIAKTEVLRRKELFKKLKNE